MEWFSFLTGPFFLVQFLPNGKFTPLIVALEFVVMDVNSYRFDLLINSKKSENDYLCGGELPHKKEMK